MLAERTTKWGDVRPGDMLVYKSGLVTFVIEVIDLDNNVKITDMILFELRAKSHAAIIARFTRSKSSPFVGTRVVTAR